MKCSRHRPPKAPQHAAGQMATGLNDVAAETVELSPFMRSLALRPPPPHTASFGRLLGSGNHYLEISTDPPRDDFTVVSIPHIPPTWWYCRPPLRSRRVAVPLHRQVPGSLGHPSMS